MNLAFEYVFPAIKGVQAGREYFVSMCPLRLLPKIFLFDEEELVPELRAQRTLNRQRIPEIARYITDNRGSYVFSAITASIDGDLRFDPAEAADPDGRVGLLRVPMSARFIINDGQHRRAAIEAALKENPELADETIAVVFFLDIGLERCQQMFADLNRYAIRPSRSLGVLYDHRDDQAKLARLAVIRSEIFRDLVEMDRSTLSARSRKLFTLSAIYSGNRALLAGLPLEALDERLKLAVEFWEEAAKSFPEWGLVRQRKLSAGDVRRDFIHSHGIVIQALGRVGNALLREGSNHWKKKLQRVSSIDWAQVKCRAVGGTSAHRWASLEGFPQRGAHDQRHQGGDPDTPKSRGTTRRGCIQAR